MNLKKKVAVAAVTAILSGVVALPASAAVRFDQTVSCNGTTWDHEQSTGLVTRVTVKQVASNPTSKTVVKLKSFNGNWTGEKSTTDGTSVTWTNLIQNRYEVHAKRDGASNCNGWAPGDGNYTWTWELS